MIMNAGKPKVITIVGPTASGKTNLAIEIAKNNNGEIISADSRQVYRGLDEGTAKIKKEETQGIPHHLIDICDIDTIYTAADFKRDAKEIIADIIKRGKIPIIAGGTFFYIDHLRGNSQTAPVPPDKKLRAALEKQTTEDLFASLTSQDSRRAAEIDPQNRRRIIRSLEIISALGKVPEPTNPDEAPYDFLMVGIEVPKEELRERFKLRAIDWVSGNFEAEVQGLLAQGISRERLEEIGFEYLLMLEYIDSTITKEEFVQKCIEKNWQYAKRQYTWLKRDKSIHWFTRDRFADVKSLVSEFLS